MPPLSRTERAALCDLLDELGPDAPTLCTGWTTRDMAVHLVLREREPRAAPGILLGGPFRSALERTSRRLGARPYPELVEAVRSGPPPLLAPLDPVVNLLEYFVHHEDVRRGSGGGQPRPEAEAGPLADALWRVVGRAGWLLTRSLGPVGLRLQRPDGTARTVRRRASTAILTGAPGELALYLTGRRGAATVTLEGPAEAVAAVRAADLGL